MNSTVNNALKIIITVSFVNTTLTNGSIPSFPFAVYFHKVD